MGSNLRAPFGSTASAVPALLNPSAGSETSRAILLSVGSNLWTYVVLFLLSAAAPWLSSTPQAFARASNRYGAPTVGATTVRPSIEGGRRFSISGVWSDACPCPIPCPCWATCRSGIHECLNVQVYVIEEGYYQDVGLSNSMFVLVARSKRSFEAPSLFAAYISKHAGRDEENAILDIIERLYKVRADLHVHRVPIESESRRDTNASRFPECSNMPSRSDSLL